MHPTPRIAVARSLRGHIDSPALHLLARRIRVAARRMGVSGEQLAELGVKIVDDREMAELHLKYMGEPGPTDVLSFTGAGEVDPEFEFELADAPFGDIVLDWQQVVRQARVRTRAGLLDEASVLLVHGLAHLLGHDHRTREEAERMHRLEQVGLRALRVADPPRPYAPWQGASR
ncbi:rRNA maturation RNase YbeY [Nannocystaceae bacterium ST9]